jgi:hypothetical protein
MIRPSSLDLMEKSLPLLLRNLGRVFYHTATVMVGFSVFGTQQGNIGGAPTKGSNPE